MQVGKDPKLTKQLEREELLHGYRNPKCCGAAPRPPVTRCSASFFYIFFPSSKRKRKQASKLDTFLPETPPLPRYGSHIHHVKLAIQATRGEMRACNTKQSPLRALCGGSPLLQTLREEALTMESGGVSPV